MREIAKTGLLALLLVFLATACSKKADSDKNKEEEVTEEEETDDQPWDCLEVARKLGWSEGQEGFNDAVDWCEGDAHRDPEAFANLLSRKGDNCAKIMTRLGEPKGVRKYEYLLMQCVKAASNTMIECALAAPSTEEAIACGKWKHPARPTYVNLFTGETTLQEGVEAPDDPLPVGDPEALAKWIEEAEKKRKEEEKKNPPPKEDPEKPKKRTKLEFRDGKRRDPPPK